MANQQSEWSGGPPRMFEVLLTCAHRLAVEMQVGLLGEMSTLQLAGLLILSRAEAPMNARDVATRLACTPSTVTQLVRRLVRDGFVVQEESTTDRRCKLLLVTDEGVTAGHDAAEALHRCMDSFTSSFTVQQKETLLDLLLNLDRDAAKHYSERRSQRIGRPPQRRHGRGGRPLVRR